MAREAQKLTKMWELFKQVKINLPLIDAIMQIPAYAKYLKDLCMQERQHKIPKKLDLNAHVSAVLSSPLPPKLKDPGALYIAIQVGNFKIERALLDLGASVNILPGSLYGQYDFGLLKRTDTTVVLVDLSTKLPRGMLPDVIVKVEDFCYPVDFLVIDSDVESKDKQPNVILGRPFLATINAQINCRNGAVDISFRNRRLRLNIFSNLSLSDGMCFIIDMTHECATTHTLSVSGKHSPEIGLCVDRSPGVDLHKKKNGEGMKTDASMWHQRPPEAYKVGSGDYGKVETPRW